MRKSLLIATVSLAALPLLGACAAITAEDIENPELAMPGAYEYLQQQAGPPVDPAWWSAFNSEPLNALEAQAIAANNQLLAGIETVLQSRAAVRQSRAPFLPQLSASQSTTFNENQGGGGIVGIDPTTGLPIQGGGSDSGYSENSSARVNASYEIDLFGADRAALRSSRAALAASIYNQRNLELQVQADVATNYFNILSLQQRLESARRNLESVERVMDLVQRQYDEGAVSGFDLSRQRSAVATARATIPQLEQQLAAAESALAILLGEFPEGFEPPAGEIASILPPPVDVGIPSTLLQRRPDLMAAEAGLAGADADVDAARAAFFPTLTLNAQGNISDLFGAASVATSFGESIAATIFSGGRLEAALERSQSRERQLIINYRQSVLNALKEVEDALVTLSTAEEREALQQIAADEAQRSFDLSEARYEAGADDLLAVLDAQRQLLSASDSVVQARQQRLNAAVSLFSALGGGWTGDAEAVRLTER
jgi:NodT family efflux transporter outer membrane factor (OMF) lipoprotein